VSSSTAEGLLRPEYSGQLSVGGARTFGVLLSQARLTAKVDARPRDKSVRGLLRVNSRDAVLPRLRLQDIIATPVAVLTVVVGPRRFCSLALRFRKRALDDLVMTDTDHDKMADESVGSPSGDATISCASATPSPRRS
jgi:hypothetical protein